MFAAEVLLPLLYHHSATAATGEGFKNVTAGVASITTAGATVVGGSWAYFKFVRGRTFRPRLSVEILGQWRVVGARHAIGAKAVFQVRVRITNIGTSKVALNQYGTGLALAFPAAGQPAPPKDFSWAAVRWPSGKAPIRSYEVLKRHLWVEPGETVSDDLLIDLGRGPTVVKAELTLVCGMSRQTRRGEKVFSDKDISFFSRRIIPPQFSMIDKA